MTDSAERVLLTGATGFIGRHLFAPLVKAGFRVRCASRHPRRAVNALPGRDWVRFDSEDASSYRPALAGCDAAIFLVHGMADEGDYEQRELEAAERFAAAAAAAGLGRIVYLGGIPPRGRPSKHLRSRLETGRILRQGSVPCVELQAGMIIGQGSESWRIVRDLSARLPVMVLPQWLSTRSEPIAVEDVVAAIIHALRLVPEVSGAFPLPGPEVLEAREILLRIARLRGTRPVVVPVPVVTPALSSYWIELVTRANRRVARQLVEGLTSDLTAEDDGFWRLFPEHQRLSFDEAARRGLEAEEEQLPLRTLLAERILRRLSLGAK